LGVRAVVIEAVFDIIMVLGLAYATFSAPNGIAGILAALAVAMIMIGWAFSRRRRLFPRK
jgi:hypothetical protein